MTALNHDEQVNIQLNKAYSNCLRFLGSRARSVKETIEYLKKKKFTSATIDKTIQRLLKEHLLDDKIFAEMFVESREKFRPRSKFALSFELKQKGIDRNIIEEAIKDIDELESAWSAVSPKLSLWQNFDRKKIKNKIFSYLKNRGFCYDISAATFKRCSKYIKKLEKEKEKENENKIFCAGRHN